METIQVVLDTQLLRATDKAARRAGKNRSALVRDALRHYLREVQIQDLGRRDREGYQRFPDSGDDLQGWQRLTAWPPE
ncbi:MAG: ribbon-helix-helix domain-containing protein [Bryobacterales bacterium]